MKRTELLQEIRMQRFEEIHDRFKKNRLSAAEAAEWLRVSERTFRRRRSRYEEEGSDGLLDRRLGKASPHRVPADQAGRVLELYRTRYEGWTVKHFHERLVEKHDLTRSYGWTKSVLHASGLVRPAVKRLAHRKKRPRRPTPGMMLHQDGSRHLWLPASERQVDLIVTLDDGTREIYSAFPVEEEGTDSKALDQLGVAHIAACSPEARDRSERMFGTLQGRLVHELADAGITTMEAANRFPAEDYIPRHNAPSMVEASEAGSAFMPTGGIEQADVLCHQEERVVSRDNTVRFEGPVLQIPASPWRAHFVKAAVRVLRYPDGRLALFFGPRCIARCNADSGAEPATDLAWGKNATAPVR